MVKDKGTAYLLWALSFVGLAGVHRLYLGRYASGVAYLMTWGFFGIGTLIDAMSLPRMVDEENMMEAARKHGLLPNAPPPQLQLPGAPLPVLPEKQILRLAASQGGMVTPQQVALHTSLSLAEARTELNRLTKEGHCTVDVGEDGSEQYRFAGLSPAVTTV